MQDWFSIKSVATEDGPTGEISIHDEIGLYGVTASAFLQELKALGPVKNISLSIHSPGGSVMDGSAIFSALKAHPARIEARVEGLAASMASVIAMAADHLTIPSNAFFMVHKPSGGSFGNAPDMRKMADLLDKIEGTLAQAYIDKTGLPAETIADMLSEETWLNGEEAVELGFADSVTEAVEVSNCKQFESKSFGFELSAAPTGALPYLTDFKNNITETVDKENTNHNHPITTDNKMDPELKALLEGITTQISTLASNQESLAAEVSAVQELVLEPAPVAEAPVAEAPVIETPAEPSLAEVFATFTSSLQDIRAEIASSAAASPVSIPAPRTPVVDEPEANVASPVVATSLSYEEAFNNDREINEYGYKWEDLHDHNEYGIQLATHWAMKYGSPEQFKANGGRKLASA